MLLSGFLSLGLELALHCWEMLPRERAKGGSYRGGLQIWALPSCGIPEQGWLYQALNNPDDDVLGPVMQSANSETTGRREKDKSLLSCCFGVAKKHMEVFMELLEHRRGSVLTPPRQTALCLPVHPLSLGWEGLGRHRVCSGCPCTQRSRGAVEAALWTSEQRGLSPGLQELQGCLAAGWAFPVAQEGRSQHCPLVPETAAVGPTPLPSPPSPHWGLSPSTVLCRGVVGTPKFLPAHFPREKCLPGFPLPLPGSACAQRLESLSIFLCEVTSQLTQGWGFLCSIQAA